MRRLKGAVMQYTKLKESYPWEPVRFDAADILRLLEKAVMAELIVRHDGKAYWIGVKCEYDRRKQLFGDQIFYIDDQEFASLEAFKSHAVLGGKLFASIFAPLEVIDTQEGDPAFYYNIVSALGKDDEA
jgi:hypothetical protein